MPTATSFTALGRGNGFPFCITHLTETQRTSINGSVFDASLTMGFRQQGKLRFKELTFANLFPYIWNLYSIQFPTEVEGGLTYAFSAPNPATGDGMYKIGNHDDVLSHFEEESPERRVCFEPNLTLSPLANQGKIGTAQSASIGAPGAGDGFARFDIQGICFVTDTSKYYLMYMLGLYGDDNTALITEMEFTDLTFNFYTY